MMAYINVPFNSFLAFEAYQDKILEITDEVKNQIKSII